MTKVKNTTLTAGIAGAVIGAGVTAATVALSDRKTRDKVFKTINGVKDKAHDLIEEKKSVAENAVEDGEKAVYKAKDETERIAKEL